MPRNQIKTTLQEIKDEIAGISDSEKKTELESLEKKLDVVMAQMDATEDSSLKELFNDVEDSVSELEVSHPRITSALNQVMSLLSSLGI